MAEPKDLWLQTVSLGTHLLTEDSAEPMLLMENMPTMLHLRTFERPRVFRYMEPGYRDSPNPDFPVAIVFTKVIRPELPVFLRLSSEIVLQMTRRIFDNLASALAMGLALRHCPAY